MKKWLRMTRVEKYWTVMKGLACLGLICQNVHYMRTEPFMDMINATITSLVIYAIWFARERTE